MKIKSIFVVLTLVACEFDEGADAMGGVNEAEYEEFGADEAVNSRGLQFFSQGDPAWANVKLGTCPETIGSAGCAITAVAMAMTSLGVEVNPRTLNDYLTNNHGYASGCLIFWGKAAEFDGSAGVGWVHIGVLGSPESLRDGLDQGKRVIVKSTRFGEHWVFIAGYDGSGTNWDDFYYLDPMDGSPIHRRIGDAWVKQGASTRVYR